MKETVNTEYLLAAWTRQLYIEYEEILWYYGIKMTVPVIQIAEMGSRWGQWDPFFRAITLSRKLVSEHSWDVVLEILKHEMAHQYVSEVLKSPHDNTHGNAFAIACEALGVASWAAKAGGELPSKIPSLRERVTTNEDEKLLARAEKLLALAQSANEHEALLAMEKVRELYAKYDIERLQAKRDGGMDSLIICRFRKKLEAHETMIFSVLNTHFFVKVVHTSLYSPRHLTKFNAAELLGTRQNLLMAEYVFYFLLKQCEQLWVSHRKQTGAQGRLRRSFQLGLLHGFSDKLASQKVQDKVARDLGLSDGETRALVAQNKTELKDYVALRFPRTVARSRQKARVHGETFARGQSEGKKITISRGVASSNRGFGGFLPGR